MSNVLLLVFNGLAFGSLLYICASGYSMIFGLMRVVNMSHGTFYLIAAFISYFVNAKSGNWMLAMLAGSVALAMIASLFKFSLFDRVMGDPTRESLLTLGFNFVVADVLLAIFGAIPKLTPPPTFLRASIDMGIIKIPSFRIFIIVFAIVIFVLLWLMTNKTRLGQIIRAGVDDKTMVSALGINIKLVFTLVYALGALLVGFGGVIGGTYMSFVPYSTESQILAYSLVVVILGGMGSMAGAALGALIVGMLDSAMKLIAPTLATFTLFGLLIIILAFKPNGLLGKD